MIFRNMREPVYIDEKRIVAVDGEGCSNYNRARILLDTGQALYVDGEPYKIAENVENAKNK